ncbi:Lrp/AsnC family transcriptional regulator [Salinibacterium sp. ZJ70]|uniref:Lrp/AsnC family transcriptional regulator n=1 Tax=Salinibacterium sp. ZJ70 TaxID=2708084 RepID=UPI00141E19DC|nr:Lrp/AsnC family transcriptional regulator [Salinibacterium sp. ZJ70]
MAIRPNAVRPAEALDSIDRRLVRLLQQDARIPNSRLADLVGVAPSTCLARVRSLVDRGIITGFVAQVSPAALGWGLEALISVGIRSGARQHITEFTAQIRRAPEVVQVFFLGGSEDFIIHVAAADSDHIREFVLAQLSASPVVASTRTSMVFDHIYNGVQIDDA